MVFSHSGGLIEAGHGREASISPDEFAALMELGGGRWHTEDTEGGFGIMRRLLIATGNAGN